MVKSLDDLAGEDIIDSRDRAKGDKPMSETRKLQEALRLIREVDDEWQEMALSDAALILERLLTPKEGR